MSDQLFFSIVIPALNEEKYLPLLLKDLTQQTFKNFEVIVVDGTSDDKTVEKANAYTDKLKLQIHQVTKRNVSYQRNFGGDKATGEWIIFMDADNRLPEHFLDGVKYQIAKHADFAVFTTWMDVESDAAIDQSTAVVVNFGLEAYLTILKKPVAFGALIGVTREAFIRHHFDEQQQVLEDTLFIQELTKDNYRFRILREPRFIFSFRRMKKEGTLKMISMFAMIQLKHLSGGNFEKDNFGYVMKGGGYYDEADTPFFKKVQEFIQHASKSQLKQAKQIINSIKEFEL